MRHRGRRLARRGDAEDGRIVILVAGLFALLALLVLGGIDVTAVQLARMHLIDAADAAAIDAADAVDEGGIYRGGLGAAVPLSDGSVAAAAGASLERQSRPAHITGWALQPGTGSPDGRTAVVRLSATVRPPLLGGALSFFGGSVSVSVESRARSVVR